MLLTAGQAAWPTVAVEPTAFVRYLAERCSEGLPPVARAGDLYIACACALGDSGAVAAVQGHYQGAIARAVATIDSSSAFAAEVAQALGLKLFVKKGDAPLGIAQYRGRSSLRGWLTTAAARTALNLRRRKGDRATETLRSGVAEIQGEADPEVLLLKARYKTEVEASIRAALAALPPKLRAVLLLQVVDGMTLPQLATMHRVSRATVARWLASARAEIFEATRRDLVARLRLTTSECESLLGLVRSQIELSLGATQLGSRK
jgi:RNA polymerase sigma-70 factor (ECF subfamily)